MSDPEHPTKVAFCGPGEPGKAERDDAEAIGFALARAGCLVLCGGLGGAMEAVCRGARRGGGTTIGILPGYDPATANRWVNIPICTGMGHGRNAILVASADVVVACGGGWGTLSEIALAVRLGRPIVVQGGWASAIRAATDGASSISRSALIRFTQSPEETAAAALSLMEIRI
jgi:hypothetical protein